MSSSDQNRQAQEFVSRMLRDLGVNPPGAPEDPEEAPSRQRKLDEAKAEIFDICDVTIGVRKKFTDAGMDGDHVNSMVTIFWHHLISVLFVSK